VSLISLLDERLRSSLSIELDARARELTDGLPRGVTVVLAGHRAAGKSTLLPHVAALLGRPGFDLDQVLEQTAGRPLRAWVSEDEASFRAAERQVFQRLPRGGVIAVGGGFLFHHAELLAGCLTALVPLSWETSVERLTADTSRPRLKPHLPLHEELRTVWEEREAKHRSVATVSVVDLLVRARRGARARRVVTLPPDLVSPEQALAFADRARTLGADLLEVRTDLAPSGLDVSGLAQRLPLLVAERGVAIPDQWRAHATLVDAPDGALRSFHADAPMRTTQALEHWRTADPSLQVKHVEPLGPLSDASRLFSTHAALVEHFGPDRVTVLATGPLALPFRAVLAEGNALDYLAIDATFSAAVGQRLLTDAVRAARRSTHDGRRARLGIIGHPLGHSRSPRLHAQPFDRLDLPPDTDVPALLTALRPHYRGFSVTNPFKKRAAEAVDATRAAVNTLVRQADGWASFNTDDEGAVAVLLSLMDAAQTADVVVLGDGGAADALKLAAQQLPVTLSVRPWSSFADGPHHLGGAVVWTWPASVKAPEGLRFSGAQVAVIAYGAPGRMISATVRSLGGQPLSLGPRWFIAQARRQRDLWESST
jgi:shikimate kinase